MNVSLVFHTFHTANVYVSVDRYAAFRVVHMHVLPLGDSRLLEKCVIDMLGDYKETANATRKSNGDSRPFHQIKMIVLYELKNFLDLLPNRLRGSIFM